MPEFSGQSFEFPIFLVQAMDLKHKMHSKSKYYKQTQHFRQGEPFYILMRQQSMAELQIEGGGVGKITVNSILSLVYCAY